MKSQSRAVKFCFFSGFYQGREGGSAFVFGRLVVWGHSDARVLVHEAEE